MGNVLRLMVVALATLTLASPAQAAVEIVCKDGSRVYVTQVGDPICDQFQCEAIDRGERYENIAERYGLTTLQLIQFTVPEGKGTPEHRSGTSPNLVVGYTVVGEFPNWTHIPNADLCIDTVEESNARRKPGKNLQWAVRHNIPSAVVVIPTEPDPCLLGHAQCTAAYKADHAVVAAVNVCKDSNQFFHPASGKCVPRISSGQIALVNTAAAAKACHSKPNHRFDFATMKCAAVGIVTKVPWWAWGLIGLLAAIMIGGLLVWFLVLRPEFKGATVNTQAIEVLTAIVEGREWTPLQPNHQHANLVDMIAKLARFETVSTALGALVQMLQRANGDTNQRLLAPEHPLYQPMEALRARVMALKNAVRDWMQVVHGCLLKFVDMRVIELNQMPETSDQARLNLGAATEALKTRLAATVEPDSVEGSGVDGIALERVQAVLASFSATGDAAVKNRLRRDAANSAIVTILTAVKALVERGAAVSTA